MSTKIEWTGENMESRYRMYATIGRVCQLLCKSDCVTDAEEWSEKVCERIYGNDARIRAEHATTIT